MALCGIVFLFPIFLSVQAHSQALDNLGYRSESEIEKHKELEGALKDKGVNFQTGSTKGKVDKVLGDSARGDSIQRIIEDTRNKAGSITSRAAKDNSYSREVEKVDSIYSRNSSGYRGDPHDTPFLTEHPAQNNREIHRDNLRNSDRIIKRKAR